MSQLGTLPSKINDQELLDIVRKKKITVVKLEKIRLFIPDRPSVKTLRRKWKDLGLPFHRGITTNHYYVYICELMDWIISKEGTIRPAISSAISAHIKSELQNSL